MGNRFLADIIQDSAGISSKAANEVASAVVEGIVKTLKREGKLSLMGFGTFHVIRRPARKGHNPATGAAIKIRAGKSVRFKASPILKKSV